MESMSPIVDCGVHYVDVMCQMTGSRPVRVQAIGTRLSDEIDPEMYNYGQLQVVFEDGSVGWYEAGWGPMMSEEAFFIKDVVGPRGCVSIAAKEAGKKGRSDDLIAHTQTNCLLKHSSELDEKDGFARQDELIDTTGEPDHQELCDREQEFFLKCINENTDLNEYHQDIIDSLKIVLAADKSVRTGQSVEISSKL
jgi:predicted dehydrogenase